MSSRQPTQKPSVLTIPQKLEEANEQTWFKLGNLFEMMTDYKRAEESYKRALEHNKYSINTLSHIASLCRGQEKFDEAIEYFNRMNAIQENGEAWGALGHCYLMTDKLDKAYHAYQNALQHLPNPKDPKLWYGIGILYDRYGSIEHAEEAFSAVAKMDPNFEKISEIYFRLGIIYKQQQKYDLSLQCFRSILSNPPLPLTEVDIRFQIGHVHEQHKEYQEAKEEYERVLEENPDHAKVLQQLGWLYHQQKASFANQSLAIQYLTRSLKADGNDAQSWYLLGRCYMVEQNHSKAYEAYQQAVYRDARNPTFWCSIGVLYYQINQYRDALDAYSRAIRLNPYISEVWYDLGTLYESCNNQIQDALDAYQRASDLDPENIHIRQRLELLRKSHGISPHSNGNGAAVSTPVPQEVNSPYQYANAAPANVPPHPPSLAGPQGPPPGMAHYPSANNPPRRSNTGPSSMPLHAHDGTRELPMLNHPNDRRSPVPFSSREDIRFAEIRGPVPPSDRAAMNPMDGPPPHHRSAHGPPPPPSLSSAHHSHHPSIRSGKPAPGRSPIPSHQSSPPMTHKTSPTAAIMPRPATRNSIHSGPSTNSTQPQQPYYHGSPRTHHPAAPPPMDHRYNHHTQAPPHSGSYPSQPSQSQPQRHAPPLESHHVMNEPLRRTSVLYDQEKMSRRSTQHSLPEIMHDHRRSPPLPPLAPLSEPSSSHHAARHAEAGAADTLMSLAHPKTQQPKRVLEMADDDDDTDEKRPKTVPHAKDRRLVEYDSVGSQNETRSSKRDELPPPTTMLNKTEVPST